MGESELLVVGGDRGARLGLIAVLALESFFGEGRGGRDVLLVDFEDPLDVVEVDAVVSPVYFDWNVFLAHFYF